MKIKKLLALVMSALLILSVVPFTASATGISDTDKLTSTITYTFDEDSGLLSITGMGAINDYDENASVFANTGFVKTVVIDEGITYLGDRLFEYCFGLSVISLPSTLTGIGDLTFSHCTSITSISIPEKVSSIGDGAFEGCTSLKNFTFPEAVTAIGNDLFYGCTALLTVTFPVSIKSVGDAAFLSCSKLRSIYYGGTQPQWNRITVGDDNNLLLSARIYYTEIEPVGLLSIEVYSKPNKELYHINETLNTDGMEIDAIYENTIIEITDYTLDYDFGTVGEKTVTVTYTEGDIICETSFTVSVEILFPTFSLNVIDEDDTTVTLAVRLDLGNFNSVDLQINALTEKIGACIYTCESDEFDAFIKQAKLSGGAAMTINYTESNKFGLATTVLYDTVDENIIICKFNKAIAEKVSSSDLELEIITCTNERGSITADVNNNLPDSSLVHDHAYELVEEVAETCCTDGYRKYKCYCGDSYTEVIPAHGHNLLHVVSQNSCEEDGLECDICKECYNVFNKVVIPASHNFGDWSITSYPTSEADGTATRLCSKCGDEDTLKLAVTLKNCKIENTVVSGITAGLTAADFAENNVIDNGNEVTIKTTSERIGTGSSVTVSYAENLEIKYFFVLYGDINGDGWYDGTDALLASLIAEGMLTENDLSEVELLAADCNHDGAVNSLDVDILREAGLLLGHVDQTKSTEELLQTSSEYCEYIELIEQAPVDETEETSPFSFIMLIINFIKLLFAILKP